MKVPLPGLKKRGAGFKYHFNVHVHRVVLREGVVLPPDATLRLLWKRGDKVASTRELSPSSDRRLGFDEGLSMVCTMYRDDAAYASKEVAFTLLQSRSAPGHRGHQRPLAKLTLDLGPRASSRSRRSSSSCCCTTACPWAICTSSYRRDG